MAEQKMAVSHFDLAKRITGPRAGEAMQLAEETTNLDELLMAIDRDRQTINFVYWRMRCELEKTATALAARKLFYEANESYLDADLVASREAYEKGFVEWRKILDKYPDMVNDNVGADSITVAIEGYDNVLKQFDEEMPKDFILQDVIDGQNRRGPPGTPPGGAPPGLVPGSPPG